MRATLSWGSAVKDLDIHSVEYNKATKATCHVYYKNYLCNGSRVMTQNSEVIVFLIEDRNSKWLVVKRLIIFNGIIRANNALNSYGKLIENIDTIYGVNKQKTL